MAKLQAELEVMQPQLEQAQIETEQTMAKIEKDSGESYCTVGPYTVWTIKYVHDGVNNPWTVAVSSLLYIQLSSVICITVLHDMTPISLTYMYMYTCRQIEIRVHSTLAKRVHLHVCS